MIDKLYGNTLKTSVSRLEKYSACPFSYYLQYGLKLKEKDALLMEREQTLEQQLAQEEQRSEELKELDLYTRSMEYIKEMANKMGFVFENEIIFKESGE